MPVPGQQEQRFRRRLRPIRRVLDSASPFRSGWRRARSIPRCRARARCARGCRAATSGVRRRPLLRAGRAAAGRFAPFPRALGSSTGCRARAPTRCRRTAGPAAAPRRPPALVRRTPEPSPSLPIPEPSPADLVPNPGTPVTIACTLALGRSRAISVASPWIHCLPPAAGFSPCSSSLDCPIVLFRSVRVTETRTLTPPATAARPVRAARAARSRPAIRPGSRARAGVLPAAPRACVPPPPARA